MRNLILKDMILNRRFLLTMGFFFFLYIAFFGSRLNAPKLYILFATFLCCILSIMIYSREDKFKATVLSCSLPSTRKAIVLSRYVLSWILMIALYAVGSAAVLAFPGSKLHAHNVLSPQAITLALAFFTLYLCLLLPLLIAFGTVGMMLFLIILQVLGIVVFFLRTQSVAFIDIRALIAWLKNGLAWLNARLGTPGYYLFLLGAFLFLNYASFKCSEFIFKRKDL